jgi:hypothetical protein
VLGARSPNGGDAFDRLINAWPVGVDMGPLDKVTFHADVQSEFDEHESAISAPTIGMITGPEGRTRNVEMVLGAP